MAARALVRRAATLATLAALLWASGCGLVVKCAGDDQCKREGAQGRCLPSPSSAARYCAFETGGCLAWDPTAGDGLASQCVTTGDGGLPDLGGGDAAVVTPQRWTYSMPATGALYAIGGSGGTVVVAGESGSALRRTGMNPWMPILLTMNTNVHGAWLASPTEVWLAAEDGAPRRSTDGAVTFTALANAGAPLRAVSGSGGDVWLAGDEGTVAHFRNGMSQAAAGAGDSSTLLHGVWAASPDEVFVVGEAGAIYHTTNGGTAWTSEDGQGEDLYGIWGTAPGDVYAVGVGVILHRDGSGAWTAALDNPNDTLLAVWGSGANDVYAVGFIHGDNDSLILHSIDRGARWTQDDTGPLQQPLYGAWGSGPKDVYVVGGGGTVLHFP